jgi:hypothetical protein
VAGRQKSKIGVAILVRKLVRNSICSSPFVVDRIQMEKVKRSHVR